VAEDHQTKNAMALVNEGAALLVKDIEAAEKLVNEAIGLFNNNTKQQELKNNISRLALPNAAERIVDEVYKIVG